jgi:hypothetical protein
MKLNRQEELFFERVGLKMTAGEHDVKRAMQAVLDDDKRIFETYLTLRDEERLTLEHEFARGIYDQIRKENT